MEWTSLNDLREKFLSFFESKGHLRLPSFSLIPNGDKSLLLINSGMAPMKKYFTGEITPPRKRVTTCQKCIRTPDIERVGKTARHGTFFEMLGNFSFGDYFKHEATAWAWEFFTKELEIPADRLWITIYQDDDEAFDIWTKEVGVPAERIVRMGKEDNFWEHGTGPCGPCSEIHFDRGEKYGCGKPGCAVGCDCDRYVEVWNLVFTQFDSDGKGGYTPLDHPNIDTGMGLERLACVMQGVDNLFEVDTVQNIMKHISTIAGVTYKQDHKTDVSLRVITDHIRSTVFMIGDGVMPSNEGRGYVLRRLLRRAARHGRLLGLHEPFLYKVASTVIKENKTAYPELCEKEAFISQLIKVEEENFGRTIDQGLSLLNELCGDGKLKCLSGEDAFRLYDTYGFPLDLTKDILEEKGITVDEDGFDNLMHEQKTRARAARKNAGTEAWEGSSDVLKGIESTAFVGYDKLACDAKVLRIVKDGEVCSSAQTGEDVSIILDTTPFYAESGGQTGDTGRMVCESADISVGDTFKNHEGVIVHSCTVTAGEIKVGDTVTAEVDSEKRHAVMRNHTSAHLLQAALRQILGDHVEQAGQLVSPERMRFDFTHFSALTREELRAVEDAVNNAVLSAIPVEVKEMPINEAKKLGAMALFGEKYGDVVRVVRCGDFSVELCGGTHVKNTSEIGLFRIISESSVAAGVRRIEAFTGKRVIELLNEYVGGMAKAASALKSAVNIEDIAEKSALLTTQLKNAERKIESLESEIAAGRVADLIKNAKQVKNVRLVTSFGENMPSDALRLSCDKARELGDDIVAVMCSVDKASSKVTFAAACGSAAVKAGANAGTLVKRAAALCGGNGGGRPDSAMAGAKEPEKALSALGEVEGILSELLR